eukprot:Gregarina_sp_Poly_1__2340@NODE_1625_length_3684_cov_94_037324_g1072_i0_p3_GENE_NODE_1625_length_3684_cov_94_037324_g1072_i0NODE_1625_length_3684_cov_94_037324_g1072_i0_p3_ORF_typecomplete_len128_score11_57Toprim/PF01751_22/2_8e05_NODE_1625_length_3684_cov_94_037324_g1072_i016031986
MPRTVLNVAEKPSVARQVSQILASGPLVRRPGPCKFNPISEFQCKLGTEELKMIFTSVRGHLMEIQFPAEFSNWLTVSPASLLTGFHFFIVFFISWMTFFCIFKSCVFLVNSFLYFSPSPSRSSVSQ